MIRVTLARPWLEARLAAPMRVLSWAPHGAGFRVTDRVLWREVRNADLGPGTDALAWLAARLPARDVVAMMTSCDVGTWQEARACIQGVPAQAVVTLGLTNAESVGRRRDWQAVEFGTINILVATGAALSRPAQIEALSIAVEARTAALMEADIPLPTGRATGTGTDCVALACPPGGRLRHAGLHTATGEAVGAVVRTAVARATAAWIAARG
ncbi:MAG: adenosylcobinamide amidohydrolase [Rubellimicrobium sp.]|nr:adenosylcobinamide amidohydrolase [Rubellimicrobium sp.]